MAHRIVRRAKWICLLSFLLCFRATASAQDGDGMIIIVALLEQLNKVADLSLGFSMARTTNTPDKKRLIPLGVQFSTTFRSQKKIGIEADLAIQAKTPSGQDGPFYMFEYLFGPRFSVHSERATFFCHTLLGGVKHWRDGATDSLVPYDGSGFAMAYGGGVDVNVRDRAAIRVVQFDWIPITESGSWITNTIRFGFGIVYRSAE